MRRFTCPICGFKAWALDDLMKVTCQICGNHVKTEPVPKVKDEESFMYEGQRKKRWIV